MRPRGDRAAPAILLTIAGALVAAACESQQKPASVPGEPCIEPGGFALVFAYNDYCMNGLVCDHSKMPFVCEVPAKPVLLGAPCVESDCASGYCVKGGADHICCATTCLPNGCMGGDRCSDDGLACLPTVRGTACLGPNLGLSGVACLDDHTVIPNVCDGQGGCANRNVAVACQSGAHCEDGAGCTPDDAGTDGADGTSEASGSAD